MSHKILQSSHKILQSSHKILQSSHEILQTSHDIFWKTSPISHKDTNSNERRVGLEPTIQLAGKKTLLCQSNSLGPTISNSGKIDVRTFTLVKDFPEAWSTGSPWRRRSMCPREPCWDRSLRGWRVGRIQDRTQWPDAKTSQPLESSQVCNFPHKSNHQGCLKMPPEVCEEEAVPRPPVNLNSTCYQWSSEKGNNVYFRND